MATKEEKLRRILSDLNESLRGKSSEEYVKIHRKISKIRKRLK